MRVPKKLLGFVVWLFFFNCGQCQECFQKDITKYDHTESVSTTTFKDGEFVKLKCQIGFTGMYKLKCEKGEWKTSIERPCAKKRCSHPGDASNGDFKLEEGTEFVFGATVVYTCKKGFQMESRINQRTCRDGGWDNAVPVCEAVKCPAIYPDHGMTASGNTEEGTYGDVVHFECSSSEEMIKGSKDIHCTETGDWSDSVPKCEEIKCTVPDIPNGVIADNKKEYKKEEILKYSCEKRFKPREGTPKCASFGWTLKPECDVVTCKLDSTTYRVKSIKPEGQNTFRAGETVEITCTETSWFRTKETKKTFTCGDDGQWDQEPVCEEITCETPYGQNVYRPSWSFRGDKRLGTEKSYSCDTEYKKKAEKATCTRDGWTPKPLCVEITCAAPEIPNAKIEGRQESVYRPYSTIQFRCHLGFEPRDRQEITCDSRGQWTKIQPCTKICAAPELPNADIVIGQKYIYTPNSRVTYKCRSGFQPEEPVEITCNSQGQWISMQNCTELCRDRVVENGFTKSSNKEEIFYSCNTGYKPFSGNWWSSVTCSKGSWSEEPRCILEEECGALPNVENGKLISKNQGTAKLQCDPGFIPTTDLVNCNSGIWETPKCTIGPHCVIPPKVENALILSKPKDFYIDGSDVTYVCKDSFAIRGESTVFCRNGNWGKTPTCEVVPICDNPPAVKNADITSAKEEIYVNGSSLTYECRSSFVMIGKSTVFCRNGNWEETPTCEAKCKKPQLNFMKLDNEKEWFDNDEVLKYKCLEPYNVIPGGEWICENGKWSGDFVCMSTTCPPPPYLENGEYFIYVRDNNKVITQVHYRCQRDYILNTQKQYHNCVRGKWETPPKCLKPCKITSEILENHNMHPIQETVYLPHNYQREYFCKSGYIMDKGHSNQYLKCFDGMLIIEQCQKTPQ